MSSALPLVKRRKLQVVGIYICSLEGSIKARFVFFLFSLLAIQQIGAFSAAIVLFIIEYCRDDVVMSFCGSFSRLESPSQIFSTVLEPCCASAKTFSSVTQQQRHYLKSCRRFEQLAPIYTVLHESLVSPKSKLTRPIDSQQPHVWENTPL